MYTILKRRTFLILSFISIFGLSSFLDAEQKQSKYIKSLIPALINKNIIGVNNLLNLIVEEIGYKVKDLEENWDDEKLELFFKDLAKQCATERTAIFIANYPCKNYTKINFEYSHRSKILNLMKTHTEKFKGLITEAFYQREN